VTGPSDTGFNLHFWRKSPEDESHARDIPCGLLFLRNHNKGGWILFSNIDSIGGYGFQEVMIIWAITSSSYGIAFVVFGNSRRISQMIINGELDSFLLQPKDILLNIIASGTVISAWGDLFYGIILFIGVHGFDIAAFLLFIFFCITGALIFASVIVFANSLTFYMGDSQGITSLLTEFLISFSIYPEGIYRGFTKFLIFTIIPAAFISLVPVRLIKNFTWGWFGILMTVVMAWMLFTYFFFKKGLKRYESGNLIVSKL